MPNSEEVYLLLKGASGLTQSVPASKVKEWRQRQEELKAKGVSPVRTKQLFREVNEKLAKLEEEYQRKQNSK